MTPEEQSARLDALSRAFRMAREADLGDLTADRVRDMDMSAYARLRADVLGDEADTRTPTRPTAPVADHAAPGYAEDAPDFGHMTMDEYRSIRHRYIRPGSGRGILG